MSASKQGPVRGACSIMESRTTTSCGKGGWEGEREKGERDTACTQSERTSVFAQECVMCVRVSVSLRRDTRYGQGHVLRVVSTMQEMDMVTVFCVGKVGGCWGWFVVKPECPRRRRRRSRDFPPFGDRRRCVGRARWSPASGPSKYERPPQSPAVANLHMWDSQWPCSLSRLPSPCRLTLR